MISRRQFFSIILIFSAVFLLFQGLQVGKAFFSDIHTNSHLTSNGRDSTGARKYAEMEAYTGAEKDEEPYILYIGERTAAYAKTVEEWAYYTGRTVRYANKLPEAEEKGMPCLILTAPRQLSENTAKLKAYIELGVDVFCMELPPVKEILENKELIDFLGIYEIHQEEVTLDGIHLFSGFLLGGERIYQAEGEKDERQDLNLRVPWYIVRSKTKTFLRGILTGEEEAKAQALELENEDMPALIWRTSHEKGEVYAVCGDYMKNREIGIGLLEAVLYETSEYLLYPVINAQVFSLLDFPIMADENEETVKALYGNSLTRFEMNTVIPQLQSLYSRYGFQTTCYMNSKYNYEEETTPREGMFSDFLEYLHEMNGELALSGRYKGGTDIGQKLDQDAAYYQQEGSNYAVNAIYLDQEDLKAAAQRISGHPVWGGIHTICGSLREEEPMLGYLTEDITLQQITANALTHTFKEDLELLGMQTVLAYENIGLDMAFAFWPETEEDEWQIASQRVFSNLTTYEEPFKKFDRVSISDSDARLRNFLSLRYTQERTGDSIFLTLDEEEDCRPEETWFILRTQNEEVQSVSGGRMEKLEPDAYLIYPESKQVEIRLRSELSLTFDLKGND